MKDTFNNFKEVKGQKFIAIRFNSKTMKRECTHSNIGVLEAHLEVISASEKGQLVLVYPYSEEFDTNLTRAEIMYGTRKRVTINETMEIYNMISWI